MTVFFKSHEITIRRLKSAGGIATNYSATGTVIGADIQPVADERVQLFAGGRIGQTFEAWVDETSDIKEGDQIDTGGYRYSVKAVTQYTGTSLLSHKHLILFKERGEN